MGRRGGEEEDRLFSFVGLATEKSPLQKTFFEPKNIGRAKEEWNRKVHLVFGKGGKKAVKI